MIYLIQIKHECMNLYIMLTYEYISNVIIDIITNYYKPFRLLKHISLTKNIMRDKSIFIMDHDIYWSYLTDTKRHYNMLYSEHNYVAVKISCDKYEHIISAKYKITIRYVKYIYQGDIFQYTMGRSLMIDGSRIQSVYNKMTYYDIYNFTIYNNMLYIRACDPSAKYHRSTKYVKINLDTKKCTYILNHDIDEVVHLVASDKYLCAFRKIYNNTNSALNVYDTNSKIGIKRSKHVSECFITENYICGVNKSCNFMMESINDPTNVFVIDTQVKIYLYLNDMLCIIHNTETNDVLLSQPDDDFKLSVYQI
jgi:hypothetical protein